MGTVDSVKGWTDGTTSSACAMATVNEALYKLQEIRDQIKREGTIAPSPPPILGVVDYSAGFEWSEPLREKLHSVFKLPSFRSIQEQ